MQQTGIKESLEYTWLGRKGDPLGTVQDIKILAYWQMLY